MPSSGGSAFFVSPRVRAIRKLRSTGLSHWTHHFSNVHGVPNRDMILAMGGNIISRFLFECRHQFAWPRRDENGDYYQSCVTCGTKYRYDWARMRRIEPVDNDAVASEQNKSSIRRCGRKVAWTPRERRLRHEVPVQFRVSGSQDWLEGSTENISKSGVLFRSLESFEPSTKLELKFEMPKELTGDAPAQVICQASVSRVIPQAGTKKQKPSFQIGCTIFDYTFVEQHTAAMPAQSATVFEFTRRQRRAR